MQDPKQISENENSSSSSSEIYRESEPIDKESNPTNNEDEKNIAKDANVEAFSQFLEKASNQGISEEKVKLDSQQDIPVKNQSLFKKFLNNGFDGLSSNPNYKMLALLVILLINLSLFFVIGNLGKVFLRNAGIMG